MMTLVQPPAQSTVRSEVRPNYSGLCPVWLWMEDGVSIQGWSLSSLLGQLEISLTSPSPPLSLGIRCVHIKKFHFSLYGSEVMSCM